MSTINLRKFLTGCIAILGLATIQSCSSTQDPVDTGGTGSISLGVTTNTAFTKAVDETAYSSTDDYTVQILNASDVVQQEFLYKNKPGSITLDNGSYTLKAFYGTESAASRSNFYVEGSTNFIIEGDSKTVSVDCYPTCGKAQATFASNMDTYFTDYYITYETAALAAANSTAVWEKGDTEPWYLKVDEAGETVTATIQVVRVSDGKTATVEKTYTLAPNKSWTLNIAPADDNGSIGIEITVDEATDDETIDIVVPSDWV